MKPNCEQVVQDVLPVVRALIAKKLIENYRLSQVQVAKKLGMTQPAISHYKRDLRGSKSGFVQKNPEAIKIIDSITKGIAKGELDTEKQGMEFCKVCKALYKW